MDDIIDRLISSNIFKNVSMNDECLNCFETKLYEHFLMNGRVKRTNILSETQLEIDIKISQKIMYYIRDFFYLSTRRIKTRKIAVRFGRFTRKKSYNPNSL
jgi:hypothetical protein